MDITLTPETEAVIRKKVADGRFANASDVVAPAVMLLDDQDRLEYLRRLVDEADQQVRDGKTMAWSPELRQRLREEAGELVRQGIPPDPDVCP